MKQAIGNDLDTVAMLVTCALAHWRDGDLAAALSLASQAVPDLQRAVLALEHLEQEPAE